VICFSVSNRNGEMEPASAVSRPDRSVPRPDGVTDRRPCLIFIVLVFDTSDHHAAKMTPMHRTPGCCCLTHTWYHGKKKLSRIEVQAGHVRQETLPALLLQEHNLQYLQYHCNTVSSG
jgi:hypothetical protein